MGQEWSRRRLLAAVGATLSTAGCQVLTEPAPGPTETPPRSPSPGRSEPAGADPGEASPTPSELPEPGEGPFARVYRRTIGSVVRVRVTGDGRTGGGSGFVHRSGRIVTNQHVVAVADEVRVGFREGEWRAATVGGTDVYADLAVLEVDDRPGYAEPLELLSADPPVGTRVLALGNPFEFEASASAGIVSGVDRSLPGPNDFPIPDAVQTDAAVNPGNSGGPLVTTDGRVVGVITAGGGENIAFAVSAPLARRIVPSLVRDGEYAHPYVGVRLQTVTPTVAAENDLDLPDPRGVIVVSVVDGGPADGALEGSPNDRFVAGQQVPVGGDVILSIDGTPTPSLDELTALLALEASPDETVNFEVLRDGERTTVPVELGERPPPP